jgi:hypothetical protein
MSTHIRCPSCGDPAANIASPDARWGKLHSSYELERASEDSNDDWHTYVFRWDDGRESFECSCGRAIWIANDKAAGGRWFVDPSPQASTVEAPGR